MKRISFIAGVGNGEVVQGVPVAVPHHEALQRVVVGGQPVLEILDDSRIHVIVGTTGLGRGFHTYQQLVSIHSCEVGDGLCPSHHSLQVAPVQVDVLQVG